MHEEVVDATRTPQKIAIASLFGAGSTLVRQWLKSVGIVPRHTHGGIGKDKDEYRIVMYRDPRDAICSRARRKFRDIYANDKEQALLTACHDFWDNRWVRDTADNLSLAHTNIRFEDYFYGCEDELLAHLCTCLHLDVEDWFFDYLLWEFSLERNKMRANSLTDFGAVDSTGIHGDHITSGMIGEWKTLFTPAVTDWVNTHWCREMARLGYE